MKRLAFAILLSLTPCAFALDSYVDDMTSTTGWTASHNGGSATAVTENGRSCVRVQTGTTAGSYGQIYRAIPVGSQNMSIKFTTKTVSLGSNSAGYAASISLRPSSTTGNFTTVYQYSDGMFLSGTDTAGRYEVGTDLTENNAWIDWEIRITAPTPATAIAAVYKNGAFVAGSLDVSRLDGGDYPNRLALYIGSADTTRRTMYVDSLEVRSWGLWSDNQFADMTGWTDADAGNGVSTATTFDGVTVADMYVPTASGTSGATVTKDLGSNALTSKHVVEIRLYHEALGTQADKNFFSVYTYRTPLIFTSLVFASNGLFARTGLSTYNAIGAALVEQGTWTTWRILFDTTTNTAWIWKNGSLVAENISTGFATTERTAGRIQISQWGYTLSGARTYVDYIRIYSEDGTLLQTVIE